MRQTIFLVLFLVTTQLSFSQSILGKWKTVDDETGVEKGVVEIYEKGGLIYARIVDIFEPQFKNQKCSLCCCEQKGEPLLGLVIIKGLKKDDDEYNGGNILDPKNGKHYKCYIKLEEKDKLKVRGFLGVSLFGRTQYWYRIKK